MHNLKQIILPSLAACILAFSMHAFAQQTSAHGRQGSGVAVENKSQMLSGIVTSRLAPAIHKETVKAYGEVVDPGNLINLRTGYLTAEAAAQKADYQLAISRNEYLRTRKLFHSSKYVSVEKLQSSEAAYKSDLADSEAARESMSNVRSTLIRNWGRVICGWVIRHSEPARAIADGRLSLVLITTPSGSATGQVPRSAEVIDAFGKAVACRFVSASPKSNQAVQGVNYFYSFASTPSLPIGLNIVAMLVVGKVVSGVVVPSSSVVWWHGKAWAYVETNGHTFTRRLVDTTQPSGPGWFVSSGIKPGDRIVVQGAQLLLSQEFESKVRGSDD